MLPPIMKSALHRSGILEAFRNLHHRETLTAVMFHRVLPNGHPDQAVGDSTWTVSTETFEHCVQLFRDQFTVISLHQLLDACRGVLPLPANSLLITFDDGWADTESYALPILRKYGLPACVFAVAAAVGTRGLWREEMLKLWRDVQGTADAAGRLGPMPVWPGRPLDESGLEQLVGNLARLPALHREEILRKTLGLAWSASPIRMASRTQLLKLESGGVSIASHGVTHAPLTAAPDPTWEFSASRAILGDLLDGRPPHAFSFPHGCYNQPLLGFCLQAGYELVFTSDPCLNKTENGWPLSQVFGRVPIYEAMLVDDRGRFRAERLASWLTFRLKRDLGQAAA
jgi:peptidoglycan/xylan/chitin deacetylase (PgdA/CDA1 family)